MRMLRAFNALSYQNSTNETYLHNFSISTKARNYRILYVSNFFIIIFLNHQIIIKMDVELIKTDRIEIEKGIYKHTYNVVGTGKCQCYKDCDCCFEKGKIVGTKELYTRSGSQRVYETLDAVQKAVKYSKVSNF